ncbi:MAG: hypothetical protein RR419_03220 [Akkermansia sp.]
MTTNDSSLPPTKVKIQCSHCHQFFAAFDNMIGKKVRCPHCSESVTAARPHQESSTGDTTPHKSNPITKTQEPTSRKMDYLLITLSIIFCVIAISIFAKTLSLKSSNGKASTVEDLLVDKGVEHRFYTPSNSDNEKLNLVDEQSAIEQQKKVIESYTKPQSTESDIPAILEQMKSFLAAQTYEEKLAFVYSPQTMRPLMKQWYVTHQEAPATPERIIDTILPLDTIIITRILMKDNQTKEAVFIHDKKTKKWLLDWTSWIAYSPLSQAQLIEQRPKTPTLVRASFSISDQYIPPFLEKPGKDNFEGLSYLAIKIRFIDNTELNGYIDRSSELAIEISQKTMLGEVPLTAEIHFPEGLEKNKNCVIIDKIIRNGWLSDQASQLIPNAPTQQ